MHVKVMTSVIISISQHCAEGQWKIWPLPPLQPLRPEWKQLAPWRGSVGSVERPMNTSTSPPVCQSSNQHWHSPSLSLHLPLSLCILSWLTFDRITDPFRAFPQPIGSGNGSWEDPQLCATMASTVSRTCWRFLVKEVTFRTTDEAKSDFWKTVDRAFFSCCSLCLYTDAV